MQKRNKPTDPFDLDEARVLLARLNSSSVSQQEMAMATGIDQSQISRLLRGDFKRVQGRALQLCKYAKECLSEQSSVPVLGLEQEIVERALALWDRTEDSGRIIVSALAVIGDLVEKRRSKSN